MELEVEKISVALLEPTLTEKEWKQELLFLKDFSIRAIYVLPYQVRRAKHLLSDTQIQIGSIIDYPFGAGTFAKKAFETVETYREGAREVFISLITEGLLAISQSNYAIFEQLAFGRSDLGIFINSKSLSDESKRIISNRIIELNVKRVYLGNQLTFEEASYNLFLFRSFKNNELSIHLDLYRPTLLEIEMLFQAGASSISLHNYRETLPLLTKKLVNQQIEK